MGVSTVTIKHVCLIVGFTCLVEFRRRKFVIFGDFRACQDFCFAVGEGWFLFLGMIFVVKIFGFRFGEACFNFWG